MIAQDQQVCALQGPGKNKKYPDADGEDVVALAYQKHMFHEVVENTNYKANTAHFDAHGEPSSAAKLQQSPRRSRLRAGRMFGARAAGAP